MRPRQAQSFSLPNGMRVTEATPSGDREASVPAGTGGDCSRKPDDLGRGQKSFLRLIPEGDEPCRHDRLFSTWYTDFPALVVLNRWTAGS